MTKLTTLCLGGMAAVAIGLAGVSGSTATLTPPASTPDVSVVPLVTSAASMAVTLPVAEMPVDCLRAFSKDECDGYMDPGNLVIGSCPLLPTPCTTATVTDATLVLPLRRNQQTCDNNGKCDESPQTDGTLKMTTNYELRLHKPCQFRGCWSGKWELTTITGAVYQGDAMGTLGVGTNRPFTCPQYRTAFCEKCLDVQFIPTPIGGLWRIAMEGAFQGKRVDADTGERLCFTVNIDWYLPGDVNGPFDFSGNFRAYGTADGIHAVPCGF